MTGSEKAVLLLLALDEEIARPVVAELGESELRKLRTTAATMHEVPVDAVDQTFRDFVNHAKRAVAVPRGGMPYLRRLSVAAIGEDRARQVFEDGKPSALTRLEHAPADALVALLADEPVQIVGAILSRISAPAAAAVLAALSPDRQAAVVAHVGRMTEVPASVLEDMAAAVAAALPSDEAATTISVDGISRAADILKAAGKDVAVAILGSLQESDGGLADDVRQAMFTFEDLVRVDARAMRELLREVSSERLVIALKGAPEDVMAAVLAGLSSRAASLVRDDLDALGSIKRAEIDKARAELVQAAIRLESEGKITIADGDE